MRARLLAFARAQVAAVGAARAEILISATFLIGWGCLTVAASRLVPRPDVVWPLSIGLLLLALCGGRLLLQIARDGLYLLTREGSDG